MKYHFAPMTKLIFLTLVLWTNSSFAQSSCKDLFQFSRTELTDRELGNTETLLALVNDGHSQSIAWLIENYKLDVNKKDEFGLAPMHLAISNKNSRVVELLLTYPEFALTPALLHHALRYGNTYILTILLRDPRADVNSRDVWGNTLLHIAVETKNMAAINLLYTFPTLRGNILNNRGQSARDIAVSKADTALIEKLNRFRR